MCRAMVSDIWWDKVKRRLETWGPHRKTQPNPSEIAPRLQWRLRAILIAANAGLSVLQREMLHEIGDTVVLASVAAPRAPAHPCCELS